MPELPEIETIKSVIEPQIKGLRSKKSPSIARRSSHSRAALSFAKPLWDKLYPLWHAEESF